jgi:hypothetical protein
MTAPSPRPRSEWRKLPAGWSWSLGQNEHPTAIARTGEEVYLRGGVWDITSRDGYDEATVDESVMQTVRHAAGYDVP